jgi:hypothetical protein
MRVSIRRHGRIPSQSICEKPIRSIAFWAAAHFGWPRTSCDARWPRPCQSGHLKLALKPGRAQPWAGEVAAPGATDRPQK